jgi:hypothetical protein
VALLPLWVNLHGGYIFGLLLIGLELVVALATALAGPPDGRAGAAARARALGVTLAACLLVSLLNPNTWRALVYPFSYLGNNASVRYVAEWVSPNFHETRYLFFEGLLFLLLIALALSPKRPGLRELLVPLVFAYLGLQSVRNIPLFAVVAVPVVAVAAQQAWYAWRGASAAGTRPLSPARGLINAAIAALIVVATLLTALPLASTQAVARAQRAAFPARAVDYLRRHPVPQPLFNSYNWGGYLIWSLYPRYRVYIDGRPDMYGDAYVDTFVAVYSGSPQWRSILDRQHIASILVEPDSVLAKLLALSPQWRRVYADAQAVIYVRRSVLPSAPSHHGRLTALPGPPGSASTQHSALSTQHWGGAGT